jgi:hypothetical protein
MRADPLEHPIERYVIQRLWMFRLTSFLIDIAASNVGMGAREPDLFGV